MMCQISVLFLVIHSYHKGLFWWLLKFSLNLQFYISLRGRGSIKKESVQTNKQKCLVIPKIKDAIASPCGTGLRFTVHCCHINYSIILSNSLEI